MINSLDNSSTENCIYIVCVVTGWWRDAGTTANVFIFLEGMYWGGGGDCLKVGVVNSLDNSPTENYIYLVCVVTGWWRDAGTTANVFIFLKGMLFKRLLLFNMKFSNRQICASF